MEHIVLPIAVTDLNALRAPHIDRVLPRPRPRLIDQIHQRLRRCHQVGIMVGASFAQLRHERRLPCLGGLLMSGAAMAAADITLVHGGVGAVADAVTLARATRRIIRQNLGWAFGYNLLLVPLAATGILPPVLAALAMAASSVTVVGNALRLRRFHTTDSSATTPPHMPAAQLPAGIPASR